MESPRPDGSSSFCTVATDIMRAWASCSWSRTSSEFTRPAFKSRMLAMICRLLAVRWRLARDIKARSFSN